MASPGGTAPCTGCVRRDRAVHGQEESSLRPGDLCPWWCLCAQGEAPFCDLEHGAGTGVQGLWFVIRLSAQNTWHIRLSSDTFPTGSHKGPGWGQARGRGGIGLLLSQPPAPVPPLCKRAWPGSSGSATRKRLCPESDSQRLPSIFSPFQGCTWGFPEPQNQATCRGSHHP